MRLLVADDDADMRQSMRLLLERAGYEVGLAQNGAKALELQRTRPADVLITDIFMLESDGLETIQCLHGGSIEAPAGIQASPPPGEAGAVARLLRHLMKPVDPDMLRCTLEFIPWKLTPAPR